jgi:hypothetical protein
MDLINVMSCSGTPILLSAGLSTAPGTVSYAFLMSSNVSQKKNMHSIQTPQSTPSPTPSILRIIPGKYLKLLLILVALLGLGAIFPPASAEFYPLPASAEPSKLPTFVESTNTYLSHKGQRQLALYWPGSRWTTTKKNSQIPLYNQVIFIP